MDKRNNKIDYIEFKANNLAAVKQFYTAVFDWEFTDYGPTYVSFEKSGVLGGFELTMDPIINGVLVVLHHTSLSDVKNKVIQFGGKITVDTFSFPGGYRFQFSDPSGNELAVWSEHEQ